MKSILVTGAAGFIGSHLVRRLLRDPGVRVAGVDKLTYAGSMEAIADALPDPRFALVIADISDGETMREAIFRHQPSAIVHLAAESHVDRSISAPADFIQTNIVGTWQLLECAREYWSGLAGSARDGFRFLHVSTDEVFGALGPDDPPFTESSRYDPHSPYSASKAASDHLVRAWHHTYGLPVVVTHSCNNYGPWQFPEKLVPVVIVRAMRGEPIPVFGSGQQVRDWLHVDDHCRALLAVLERAAPGTNWNIGGGCELTNLELVHRICGLLDALCPTGAPHARLIRQVADRPGHDWRYALDTGKTAGCLGWSAGVEAGQGLLQTVEWYVANKDWWSSRIDATPEPARQSGKQQSASGSGAAG